MAGLTAAWKALRRRWLRFHLALPEYLHILDDPPPDEWVSLDCETTGLKVGVDEIIAIGAVRILGDRVLASERFEVKVRPQGRVSAQSILVHRLREQDVATGLDPDEAVRQLLHFMGPRPLVGYYLEFDVAMLNRLVFPLLGFGLPQPKIEVSALYHALKMRQLPAHQRQAPPEIDLRLATLMNDLGLPEREAHDPVNDAVMAALAFIKLRHLAQA